MTDQRRAPQKSTADRIPGLGARSGWVRTQVCSSAAVWGRGAAPRMVAHLGLLDHEPVGLGLGETRAELPAAVGERRTQRARTAARAVVMSVWVNWKPLRWRTVGSTRALL